LPNGDKRFTNFSKHPWYGVQGKVSTPAGAYQITSGTWQQFLKVVEPHLSSIEDISSFTPLMQDRLAVAILEFEDALPLARTGNIQKAVNEITNR
jgi:muramidase (phage lysozyme)